jgi:hypothetical protein
MIGRHWSGIVLCMRKPRSKWDALKSVLELAPEIREGPSLVRAAVLATSPAADCENVNAIRGLIRARNWEAVLQMRSGGWTSDWLQWLLVQRVNAPTVIVEVYYAYDLFVNDSASYLFELPPKETETVCQLITSWEGP